MLINNTIDYNEINNAIISVKREKLREEASSLATSGAILPLNQ